MQRGTAFRFSAHVRYGQMAGWIKLTLATEVGLGPGDIVLDGDPAPSEKGGTAPNFPPMFVVAKRLDGSRCHLVRGRPQPRRHCVSWGASSSPRKGGTLAPPSLRPMSIVAKYDDRRAICNCHNSGK